ncbi:MAG: acyl-CoA synthetase [Candidatus Nezhaarchaeota archaeon]|nr:acyl-CoA synthetase [Candidatus Nezhaarchaeota archaeon]
MIIEKYGPPKELWPEFKLDFPEAQSWPRVMNIAEILIDGNVKAGRGGKPAYLYEDRVITYRELQDMVNVFGNALRSLGIGVGDRVMLRLPNIPEFPIAHLATQKIGAVSVCTFTLLRAREVASIANDSESKAIITTPELLGEVEKAKSELRTVRHVILAGAKPSEVEEPCVAFSELMDRFKDDKELEPVRVDWDEVALLLYTSGTTGPPKGCIHTHRDYLAVADCYAKKVLLADEGDVWGGAVTMAFAYGHMGFIGNPLRLGGTASLYGPYRFDPVRLFELIEKHRVTILYAVPTAYRAMVALKEERKRYDFSSLRLCVSGGEYCPPSLYYEIKKFFGCEFLEQMGTTELLHCFVSSQFGRSKPGSAGLPVPGFEVKIFDEDGRELPRNKMGYLAVKGPIGIRYWKRPDKQAEYVKNGWNYTGDVGYIDEDGFFFYVGRADDIVKTAAYKVSPHEVEEVLLKHPAVAEAAVIGIPDPERGQAIKAFVVLRPSYRPSAKLAEGLRDFVKDIIAPYKAPKEVEFIAELPKTESGKISRTLLRRRELEKLGLLKA